VEHSVMVAIKISPSGDPSRYIFNERTNHI
jgi:hypothetical protein